MKRTVWLLITALSLCSNNCSEAMQLWKGPGGFKLRFAHEQIERLTGGAPCTT